MYVVNKKNNNTKQEEEEEEETKNTGLVSQISISPISRAKSATNVADSTLISAKRESYDNKGIAKLAMLPFQQIDFKKEEKGDKHGGKYNAWENKVDQSRARAES